MFERDYLMRIIMELGAAIRRSIDRSQVDHDPGDAAQMLDAAVGEATELDGAAALGRLRTQQALAIAAAYGHDLTEDDGSPEAIEGFLVEDGEK